MNPKERRTLERKIKKERQVDNDIYDLRLDIIIELLAQIRDGRVLETKRE